MHPAFRIQYPDTQAFERSNTPDERFDRSTASPISAADRTKAVTLSTTRKQNLSVRYQQKTTIETYE
jgi:hypothetical protein